VGIIFLCSIFLICLHKILLYWSCNTACNGWHVIFLLTKEHHCSFLYLEHSDSKALSSLGGPHVDCVDIEWFKCLSPLRVIWLITEHHHVLSFTTFSLSQLNSTHCYIWSHTHSLSLISIIVLVNKGDHLLVLWTVLFWANGLHSEREPDPPLGDLEKGRLTFFWW
jgi:hypothetical protein